MSVTINPKSFWETIGQAAPRPRDSFLMCPDEERYWESGQRHTDFILNQAQKRHANLDVVVEYGCGDGRIARFVSPHC